MVLDSTLGGAPAANASRRGQGASGEEDGEPAAAAPDSSSGAVSSPGIVLRVIFLTEPVAAAFGSSSGAVSSPVVSSLPFFNGKFQNGHCVFILKQGLFFAILTLVP
jgi:hypothetical protein